MQEIGPAFLGDGSSMAPTSTSSRRRFGTRKRDNSTTLCKRARSALMRAKDSPKGSLGVSSASRSSMFKLKLQRIADFMGHGEGQLTVTKSSVVKRRGRQYPENAHHNGSFSSSSGLRLISRANSGHPCGVPRVARDRSLRGHERVRPLRERGRSKPLRQKHREGLAV